MSGRFTAARANLSLLQDVMKRDPQSYRPEFLEQYLHYQQTLQLFYRHPQDLDPGHLMELVNFIAQVGHHFKDAAGDFAPELLQILRTQGPNLEADLRMSLVKAVILLRNRKIVPAAEFNALTFDYLLKCRDKALRKFLFSSVLAHVKDMVDEQVLVDKIKEEELQKTEACFHGNVKIRVTALKFMLGAKRGDEGGDGETSNSESEDEEDAKEEEGKTVKELTSRYKAGKKTKKRKKQMEKAKSVLVKENKKTGRRKMPATAAALCSVAVIQELYDPHEFAEKLFKALGKGKGNDRFEVSLSGGCVQMPATAAALCSVAVIQELYDPHEFAEKLFKALGKGKGNDRFEVSLSGGCVQMPATAAALCSVAVIQELYDPHEFAEKLFKALGKGKGNDRFEVSLSGGCVQMPATAAALCSVAVIQELYDPHEFAEKLFKALGKGKGNDRFEVSLSGGCVQMPATAAALCSVAVIQELYDPHEFAEKLFKALGKGKGNDRFEVSLSGGCVQMPATAAALCSVAVIQELYDPHEFAEKLFKALGKGKDNDRFEPHQRDVTRILLMAAQASHELVPPDVVADVVKVVADNFVSDRNAPEVMTVGLNALREILANCPLAVEEDLLRDLTEYKRYRNKNVSAAARSIIQLFRDIAPTLLHRKDRDRPSEAVRESGGLGTFGASKATGFVPGAEVLLQAPKDDKEDEWQDVDSEEHEDEDSGEESGEENEEDSGEEASPQAPKLSNEEERRLIAEKAAEVSSGRILSQDEFRAIQVHQLRKKLQPARAKKRPRLDSDSEEEEEMPIDDSDLEQEEKESRKRLPRLADITHLTKRPKMDKAERLQSVKEGREGRDKFGGGKKKGKPHAGKTNQTTKKGKAFQMVRQKAMKKNRNQSFRQRQQSLKNYLTKQKKMK